MFILTAALTLPVEAIVLHILAHSLPLSILPWAQRSQWPRHYHLLVLAMSCDQCACLRSSVCSSNIFWFPVQNRISWFMPLSAYIPLTIPKPLCIMVPRWKYMLRFRSCELLAPFWNKYCLLKLPSSSKASSFCTSSTDDMLVDKITETSTTRYCVFLYLEGMLLFPCIILLEWTGTHLTCFGGAWGAISIVWVYLLFQC